MPRGTGPAPIVQPAGAPAGAPAPGAGGGLLAKLGSRNGAILAAGATVALVGGLALIRGKSGSSGSSDGQATPIQAYDSGPYDMWGQWETQYDDLAGRVSTLENPSPPTPVTKPPTGVHVTPLPAPILRPPATKPPVLVASRPPITSSKPAKPPPAKTYTVKRGDTLSGIAARFHISMATLKKLNPVYWTNPKYRSGDRIWSGDRVRLG